MAVGKTLGGASIANVAGATMVVNGTASATGVIANTGGTVDLGNGANLSAVGGVTNTGTIVMTGATAGITGNLTSGAGNLINLDNGTVGNTFTVTGAMSGPTAIKVAFNSAAQTADKLVVTGASTDAVTAVVDIGAGGLTPGKTAVIYKSNTSAGGLTISAVNNVGTVVPLNGLVLMSAAKAGNTWSVQTQANPALGGMASGFAVIQSLIDTVIERPTSAFASTPVYDTNKFCSPGAWARVVGGRAQGTASSSNGISDLPATVKASYSGIQGGGDFGCYNSAGGWDMVFGAQFGLNHGNTSQNVFAIDPSDPSKLDYSALTSVTKTSFNQNYEGLYFAATKGNLRANLQLRTEHTGYDLSDTNGLFFLPGAKTAVNGTTLTGDIAMAHSLGNGLSLIPRAGFGITRMGSSTLTYLDGSTLTMDGHTNSIGYLSASLQKTTQNAAGDSLVGTFVTATIYNDFSPKVTSTYTTGGSTTEFKTSNLGTYGELSVGVDYLKVLDAGAIGGAKQMNASIRIDDRFSKNVSALGLTAQLRFQF